MSKNSFLDPIANARTIAFVFFLIAFAKLLDLISGTATLFGLFYGVCCLISGIGLRKQKLWGVYCVGFLVLFELSQIIMFGFRDLSLISLAISALLFLWFYSARDRFKK